MTFYVTMNNVFVFIYSCKIEPNKLLILTQKCNYHISLIKEYTIVYFTKPDTEFYNVYKT